MFISCISFREEVIIFQTRPLQRHLSTLRGSLTASPLRAAATPGVIHMKNGRFYGLDDIISCAKVSIDHIGGFIEFPNTTIHV
jgi:hypothetical protein